MTVYPVHFIGNITDSNVVHRKRRKILRPDLEVNTLGFFILNYRQKFLQDQDKLKGKEGTQFR